MIRRICSRIGKVIGFICTALLAAILCMNIYVIAARAITGNPYPTVFGYYSAVVVSGSMSYAGGSESAASNVSGESGAADSSLSDEGDGRDVSDTDSGISGEVVSDGDDAGVNTEYDGGVEYGGIDVNDMVIVRASDAYRVGDVITFVSGSSLVTHRIADEQPDGYITRGDANNTCDAEPVAESDIIGKVVCVVPGVGKILTVLQSPAGMAALFVIAVLLCLWSTRTGGSKVEHETSDSEARNGEARQDEVQQGEARQDEVQQDEVRQDEVRQDEVRQDEVQKDETQHK